MWCAAKTIRSQGAPFYVSIQPLCIWAHCLILAIYVSDKGIYKVLLSSQGLQAMCSCSRGKAKVRLSLAALVPVTIVLTTSFSPYQRSCSSRRTSAPALSATC